MEYLVVICVSKRFLQKKIYKTVCYECESSNYSKCTIHPKITFVKDVEVPMVSLITVFFLFVLQLISS